MIARAPGEGGAWGAMSAETPGDGGGGGSEAVGMAGLQQQQQLHQRKSIEASPRNGSNGGSGTSGWGTCAELLLVSAVKRHGVPNWSMVALELRSRAILLDVPPSCFSDEKCRFKYDALKGRFAASAADVGVSWFEELRKLRMSHLKEELQVHDSSIGQLQSRISELEEERAAVQDNDDDGGREAGVSTTSDDEDDDDKAPSEVQTTQSSEGPPPVVSSRVEEPPKRSEEADAPAAAPATDAWDLETSEKSSAEEQDTGRDAPPGSPGEELAIEGSGEGMDTATGSPREAAPEQEEGTEAATTGSPREHTPEPEADASLEKPAANEERAVGKDGEGEVEAAEVETHEEAPAATVAELDSEKPAEAPDPLDLERPSDDAPCAAEGPADGEKATDGAQDGLALPLEIPTSEDAPIRESEAEAEAEVRGCPPQPAESDSARMAVDIPEIVPLPAPPEAEGVPVTAGETPPMPSGPSEGDAGTDGGVAAPSSNFGEDPRPSCLSPARGTGQKRSRDSGDHEDEEAGKGDEQRPQKPRVAAEVEVEDEVEERPRQRQRTVEASEILTVDLTDDVVEQQPAALEEDARKAELAEAASPALAERKDAGTPARQPPRADEIDGGPARDESAAEGSGDGPMAAVAPEPSALGRDDDRAASDARSGPSSLASRSEHEPMSLVVDLPPFTDEIGPDSQLQGEGSSRVPSTSTDGPRDPQASSPDRAETADGPRDVRARSLEPASPAQGALPGVQMGEELRLREAAADGAAMDVDSREGEKGDEGAETAREKAPGVAGDGAAEDGEEVTGFVHLGEEAAKLEVELGGPRGDGSEERAAAEEAGDARGEKAEEIPARVDGREEDEGRKRESIAGDESSDRKEAVETAEESRNGQEEAEEGQQATVPDSGDSQIDKSEVGSSMDSVEDVSPSSRKPRREPKVPGKLLPLLECLRAISAHKFAPLFKQRQEYQDGPQYERLVKRHVDLGMVRARLEEGAYSGSVEFFRDLLLIFTNALVFSGRDSPEYAGAKALRGCALAEMDRILQTEAVLKQSGPATRKREGRKPGEAQKPRRSAGAVSDARKKGAVAKAPAVSEAPPAPAITVEEAAPQAASRATGNNSSGKEERGQNGRSGTLKKLPWARIQDGAPRKEIAPAAKSQAAKKSKPDGSKSASKGQGHHHQTSADGRPMVKKAGKAGSAKGASKAAAKVAPAKMKDVMCIDVERKGHPHNSPGGMAAAAAQPAVKQRQQQQQQAPRLARQGSASRVSRYSKRAGDGSAPNPKKRVRK